MARRFEAAAAAIVLCLAVCLGAPAPRARTEPPLDAAYRAVDALLDQTADDAALGRVLVATLVDINAVNQTSMFGRQFAGMAANAATRGGPRARMVIPSHSLSRRARRAPARSAPRGR